MLKGELGAVRRAKGHLGQRAGAGCCRDLAILAAGVPDGGPIADEIGLDVAVEAGGAFSAPVGGVVSAPHAGANGRPRIATKEGREEGPSPSHFTTFSGCCCFNGE